MSASDRVTRHVEDHVATVTLNRPEARNALDLAMCHALVDTFRALDADPEVRAVVLHGAGPSFCAGADLKERADKDASWIRGRRIASFEAYRVIETCSKPVLALVHGDVVGSGGEIAMSCDFVYAADDVRFRFPEVHWGTIGATQRLQRVIGKRRAKELLFTNGILDAQEAERRGLVQRVFAAGELLAAGREAAATIAAAPQLAVRLTKQAIDLGHEVTLEQGIRIELEAIEHNLAGGEWRKGQDRFLAEHAARDEDSR